jgi:dTDP-4-dehydrorhamnose reductase
LKLIVTGAGGMVGRAVVGHCTDRGAQVTAMDHAALDITNESVIASAFDRERPDVLINCAAWADVDACQRDPARAQLANAVGPELLAAACRKHNAQLITISTDYVFDGEKDGFYTQRDQPNPQSVYAVTKLDGERRAQNTWARTIVVRSGYIFGKGGTNFLATFLPRLRRGEQLRVIDDMFGTPTYAEDLVKRLYELALLDLPGIYHVVNAGDGVSFAEFARAAAEEVRLDPMLLTPVSCTSLGLPAPRPRNSRLRCLVSEAIGLEALPDWRDALADFTQTLHGSAGA